ncbi:hypothetical protein COCC4DRAFT_159103 [Bipolaris maydis ATCC 48331]|uniref:EF-hand domain-containing protein n=2 Tax=Cochliobolus heterostrophus TaxID=5016 RepID=M2U738_COCH5|nr:uncharacterized protein COCC4DRAFT_159103 [Bipolaris maydis ATCC 48331]EMD89576.1 hypothetical protein COCHEDRAFT_1177250 [Bipolaris maydis C5]ENI10212.1 hypothetical protein COCC4DRAFT_159103 [Bipolaris maydis ATCC 48331]KAJ6207423.1 hypothetical protein PSV09DRAFT_1177250 [Bipolaris maydis]
MDSPTPTPTPYKPSPLSFNNARQSPFRRPGSIREASPSTLRPSTPSSSPLKPKDTTTAPAAATGPASQNPPPWLHTRTRSGTPEPPASPGRHPSPGRLAARPPTIRRMASSDALAKLPPPLLHSMRESFSVMDRDDDGHVNAADVADMLSQLGLSATPSQLSTYFNGAQSINLANYLTTLSDLLANLSHQSELSAAFEAFDDNDDGQIDLAELKDALLHTAPQPGETLLTEREINMVVEGFSGRRAFGKGGKGLGRGEVFRYHDFLANLTGGGNGADNTQGAAASA